MKSETEQEIEQMHRSFRVCPSSPTGLRWIRQAAHGKTEGDVAGCVHKPSGYCVVGVGLRTIKAHRVVWILERGPIPDGMFIDHLNGIRAENKIENLQLASKATNNRARNRLDRRNKSGFMGVGPIRQRWRAYIIRGGKQFHLGCFDDAKEAARAFNKAAIEWASANGEKARFLNAA